MALLTGIALAFATPLPGVTAMPEGSEVKIVGLSGSVYASGVVRAKALVLNTPSGARRLPPSERVQLWIGVPDALDPNNRDLSSVSGLTTATGMDVWIGEGKDRQTLTMVLRDAYGIRLELR
jgi:hypothetical protein